MTFLRRIFLAILFCGVFLIGLLAFAPASLMGQALERVSGATLSLAQTSGSIWQGSGVVLARQKTGYQALGSYHWKLNVFNTSLQVSSADTSPMMMRYIPFTGRVEIEDMHLRLPASVLEIVVPQVGIYQLHGMFDVHGNHLAFAASEMNGEITVDWQDASSGLSEIHPLGDYRILLQGKGSVVDARLSTLSGKLQLSGKGSFDKAGGIHINGTAQANASAAAELNELLHHIGPEFSQGVHTFELTLK